MHSTVSKYAPLFKGRNLSVYSDHATACHMLNQGYSNNRTTAAIPLEIAAIDWHSDRVSHISNQALPKKLALQGRLLQ